jgi:hypothetical protein
LYVFLPFFALLAYVFNFLSTYLGREFHYVCIEGCCEVAE